MLRGKVNIVQGDISVAADQAEATGLDAQDSHWVFTGAVHVHSENQGELYSDQATVQFSRGNVAQVEVSGKPAQFEQARATPEGRARGHADTIDYDVLAGVVKLIGDAWLSDGRNEINYPQITYNVREKSMQAQGGRGHSTVVPRSIKENLGK
jgi:lipopolysaccharide transport protein LptA